MTHSETIFELACRRAGYEIRRPALRDLDGVKSADFIIRSGDLCVVAEVEELRPNREDLREIRASQNGEPIGGGCTIGARPRQHIKRAARQLKPYAIERVPLLIVLYDNVRLGNTRVAYPMFYLQPHDIDAAMYGDRTAYVSTATSRRSKPDQNGGKRTCTATEKTYVSAVAVISDADDQTLIFYHNCFAAVPLVPPFFRGPNFFHVAKAVGEPWKWVSQD
jgi:hypothetical protein